MNFVVPILAFGFTSPLWLWGLGSIAVPIAIHLWQRQNPRVQLWAPMTFLREVVNRHARRVRLESLLVLLVRCLMLALLAIAVARPFAEQTFAPGGGTAHRHKVLLIDGSLSMSARTGESTRMERARQLAREIVLSAGASDTFNLCRIGNATSSVIIRRPAHDAEDVLREIDRLPQLDDVGDLLTSLQQVKELLSDLPSQGAVELFVVSDFQATQWAQETPAEEARLRQLLQEVTAKSRLFLVDVGGEGVTNLSLKLFQVPEQVALTGRPFHAEVTLVNHSSEEQTCNVEILADRVVRSSQQVTVPPGAEHKVTARLKLSEAGHEVLMEARIPDDAITTDNRIQRVVAGRRHLEVLLVDGKPADKLADSASGFVKLALAPAMSAGHSFAADSSPFVPTVCTVADLATMDLGRFDTIVMCEAANLPVGDVTRLTEFVNQGGGLVMGWGESIDAGQFAERWNALVPVDVREIVNRADDPVTFETGNLDHWILGPFRGRSDSGLATSPVASFARISPKTEAGWQTVLPYVTGDPAILERTVGQGRVVLMTTSLDDSWGNWVLWPSFVPLINRVLQFSMTGRIQSEPLLVGSPVRLPVRQTVEGTVMLPDAKSVDALVESHDFAASPSETVLFWPETGTSGFYQISAGSPVNTRRTFAINADSRESDPRTVTEETLRRGVLAGTEFAWGLEHATTTAKPVSEFSDRSNYARPLVWMALGLLVVEMLLSWRFRWGVISLAIVMLWGLLSIWGMTS
jgi:hypothetical protein